MSMFDNNNHIKNISKSLLDAVRQVRESKKPALDPVGKEDSDVDNDGKANTKSDKYLLNRRSVRSAAIKENEQIDEVSHEVKKSWINKTWPKHMNHRADDPKSPTGWSINKPTEGPMSAARQKVFKKASDDVNKEESRRYDERIRNERQAREPKVHDLRHLSHGDVYDHTQTSDKIKDGDILHVKGGVGAMLGAYPTMIHGTSDVLHRFKKGSSIDNFEDGSYHKTAKAAAKVKGLSEETMDGVSAGSMADDGHMCATKIFKEGFGEGTPLYSQHADPDRDGNIAWYDCVFEDSIERCYIGEEGVEVLVSEMHSSHSKSSKKMKKKMEEEVEELGELSKDTLDSYASKALKDREKHRIMLGDQKNKWDQRTKGMTRAAMKYSQQKEEVEQIDELSRKTLSSYVKKAANSAADKGMEHGAKKAEADEMDRVMNRHMSFGDKDKVRDIMKTTSRDVEKPREKAMRRLQGIDRAANRLAKEEVEQIDELSKNSMLKYLSANKKDDTKARETGDYDKMTKRMRGTDMAVRKYTAKPGSKSVRVPATEEVEQIDEAMDAKDRYVAKHAHLKALVKSIGEHLDSHHKEAHGYRNQGTGNVGPSWGHVGDLGRYEEILNDVHDSLARQGEYAKMGNKIAEDTTDSTKARRKIEGVARPGRTMADAYGEVRTRQAEIQNKVID